MTTRELAPSHRLSRPAALAYGGGSLGMGVYSTVPSVLLLYFLTQVLALPVALAPLAVLAPKLVIMVAEPLVGVASDRLRTPWGRRAPFLLAGSLLSAATFVALFSLTRGPSMIATLVAAGCAYLLASLAFSLFAVPYVAMPTELSDQPAERTRLVGLRMMFVFMGVLLGVSAAPLIVERFGGGAAGYRAMAMIIAAASLASMLGSFMLARRLRSPATPSGGAFASLGRALRYRPYVTALAIYVVIMIGFGALSSAGPYFVTFALGGSPKVLAEILGTQMFTAFATVAPAGWVTNRLGFARTLLLSLALGVAGTAVLQAATGPGNLAAATAGAVLLGLATAGVQVAAFALLADVSARGAAAGLQAQGLMTGIWTAAEKVALAAGPQVTGLVLALGGFVSATERSRLPASALTAAGLAMTAAPAAFFLLALVAVATTRRQLDA